MIKQTVKNAAIDQAIKKFSIIFFLSIFILLFYSTSIIAEARLVVLKPDGNVWLINQLGLKIRQYSTASSSHNIALHLYNNKIHVLRKNYQVFLDMDGMLFLQ